MFNIKLEENSYKTSFNTAPVKIQWSKNIQGDRVEETPRQIRLKKHVLAEGNVVLIYN